MKREYLNHLIKINGEKIQLKANSVLFKSFSNDYNLYYIERGTVQLLSNGVKIFELGTGEIIGEKSFLENIEKALDGICISECTVYKLTNDFLGNCSKDELNDLLFSLSFYLSSRVDKINIILSYIDKFNKFILSLNNLYKKELIKEYFSQLVDLEGYIILKNFNNEFMQLDGDLLFSEDIEKLCLDSINNNYNTKVGKNYIYVYTGKYIYILFGKPKLDDYIITNLLLYCESAFIYLGELVQNNKNKEYL